MLTSFETKTPGKLYLAGEYAVLTPNQPALVMSIPIYMQAKIEQSQTFELYSDLFDYSATRVPDSNYALIQESISVFEDFLGRDLQAFRLIITGKLGSQGKKYGLGSSGSVVILILKALAGLYKLSLSKDELFKLAAYVLLKRGDNGSMGDLAAISHEDLVYYQSFDRQKIARKITQQSLLDLLSEDWGYVIVPVKKNIALEVLVGWTGQPAISSYLIKEVKGAITDDFITQSAILTQQVREAIEDGNIADLTESFSRLGQLLKDLHPAIVSPRLTDLIVLAEEQGAIAKSSGAGGGDCGLALLFEETTKEKLISTWQEKDISLLYEEKWRPYEP